MSYYFGGPWGDYAPTATAGSAATVLRPRISVKDQTYSKGYDGSIQANASGITSAIGGVGVVTYHGDGGSLINIPSPVMMGMIF